MTVFSRYLVHTVVLILAIGLSGYASVSKGLPQAAMLRLGVVNAQGLAFGQGGAEGSVELGRAGTIVKPIEIPNATVVVHTPTLYTVRDGEDLYAIAKKFNLSADDVRWSNLGRLAKTDVVRSGDQIQIPPIPGVVILGKAGDTVASLASTWKVDQQSIIDFNYLKDPIQIAAGATYIIPNGTGPMLFPRRASDTGPHMGPFSNSKFVYGQCTYYAASRRYVPWTGDAWMWYGNAKAMGFAVGNKPEPGAFMVTWESIYYGHVAYVEQVNADGSFVVSEMNYKAWDVIDERTLRVTDVPLIGFIY